MFWVVSNKVISLHLIIFNLSSYTGASIERFFKALQDIALQSPHSLWKIQSINKVTNLMTTFITFHEHVTSQSI